jgi:hypothetical protein
MIGILLGICIACMISNLLGWYTLCVRLVKSESDKEAVLSLTSAGMWFGIEWSTSNRFRLVLFGKRLAPVSGQARQARSKPVSGQEVDARRGHKAPKRRFHLNASVVDLVQAFRAVFRVIHVERLHADLTIGTGNPAATGILYGLAGLLTIPDEERFRFSCRPDFTGNTWGGRADLALRFAMVRVLVALVRVRLMLHRGRHSR